MSTIRHPSPAWRAGLFGAFLTVTLLACGGGKAEQAHESGMGGMEGMEGMEGMQMPAAGEGVQVSAEMLRTFGVTFDTVGMRPLSDSIRAMGVVRWDETRVRQVTARVTGYVERLRVAATGQSVARGDTLLALYAPDVVAALDELRTAVRWEKEQNGTAIPGIPTSSTALVASARARLARWEIPADVIARVMRGEGDVPGTVPLLAPSAGIVIDKAVEVGQAVQPGSRLYSIVDPSVVWLDVEFRESDAAEVKPGQGVAISFTGDPADRREGRVSFVYPTIDPVTRSIRARVVLDNGSGTLQAGRFAEVRLLTAPVRVLTVPTSAVIPTGEGYLVFRDAGDGRLVPVTVEVGQSAGGFTEIRAGLTAGERVVTSAQYLLEAESNLGAVMRSMLGQMGSGMSGSMPGMDHGAPTAAPSPMPGMDHGTPAERGTSMPGMNHDDHDMPSPPTGSSRGTATGGPK